MHPLPLAPNAVLTAKTQIGEGMTVSHSHSQKAHGHQAIASPVDQAQIQSASRLANQDPQPYSAILDAASPHAMWSFGAVFRSTTLLVWALTASCFIMAQDSSDRTSTDVSEVEEVVVSSRIPDLIDQIGVSVSVIDEDMMRSLACLLYTSPSPRDRSLSRMPSSA